MREVGPQAAGEQVTDRGLAELGADYLAVACLEEGEQSLWMDPSSEASIICRSWAMLLINICLSA